MKMNIQAVTRQTKYGVPPTLLALCQRSARQRRVELSRYLRHGQTLHFVPDPPKEGMATRL
jgi:hypothetical protein